MGAEEVLCGAGGLQCLGVVSRRTGRTVLEVA